ncbi:ATP-dependent metallopeptidase FtsH/Yme1/Tma family protein [Candidatus Methylopumilus universalis]|uniref:ATP-dependent zinc metalloprotease FtsH n=2 Tax=Candidatus Methylopumilus TaxID=1679002 RepID=UPI00048B9C7B|nr:ATP-dependent zinc metalloprotease FtsH [Candidatus Methylopumilus universalis]QDC80466.1 ATP-dependent metallopeptidase FtsH/Yme1/Tma family protein [Candidatus Methylopumilus universalis]QDC81767.1 ATP-dependent metallopeptidase FtsH/Yme1/Tma family protein [Candidatus Methylopumilus universalis]QDC88209.1 ATP-dependent metallopeptidase FtsH/Yme1/Tma family protein [Candidatus Methylopumilus universalis]QDC96612.1 ATP-dependent metallopeptidase FtsH/Yme1/Tma family protein [Candidatus Meth
MNNNTLKSIAIWVAIALILMTIFNQFSGSSKTDTPLVYSQFMQQVKEGRIAKVEIDNHRIKGTTSEGKKFNTYAPTDPWLVSDLLKNNVIVEAKPEEQQSVLMSIFISWFPMILLVGVWIFFMRQMQGGSKGGGPFSFGKSKARQLDQTNNQTTFADVAGCDEAKEEVTEIVEFLKDPSKFHKLGGRIPRGVLMVGPPGTGKTLLARAIAGEAKVPFFTISGSDFVEMFVGVGAARVRDMFEQSKKSAPCIIFIDEIDAVGRHRGQGSGGGNDEREQTLNQLLVELDGFEPNSGVIVIAATNRADVLDKALLRPGRFDRQVMVSLPDIKGREEILLVHMRKIPADPDVKASIIARGTPGFSGADLANLVNESALFAARRNKRTVDMQDFEDAKDKIFMGPERKSLVMREEERMNTAFHESGHAVVAKLLPHADPVHKVTIMPRGWALGLTWQLPEFDRISNYKNKMLEEISILFGGRIAEEVFMKQMSTGASNDFERATKLARDMVTRYGMSDKLGTMVYVGQDQDSFFGSMSSKTISEATQQKVDAEIRRILDEQYSVARKLIEKNRRKVEAMAKALLEYETIDADQINDIMAGKKARPPKPKQTPNPPKIDKGSSGTKVTPVPQPSAKG